MARQNDVCGHLDRKHKARGMCRACSAKEHYRLNRDRYLAQSRKWHQNNRDRHSALNKEWARNNPEKRRALERRSRGLPTPTRPEPTMCESCNKPCATKKALCLDHCHKTGTFRGWLCNKCNRGVGHLGDSIIGVQRALDYLVKSEGPLLISDNSFEVQW